MADCIAVDSRKVVQPSRLCRLCALPKPDMILLYGAEGVKQDLAAKINTWLPISVSRKDPLPKQVCEACVHRLKRSLRFSISVLQAEYMLREFSVSQEFGFEQSSYKNWKNPERVNHETLISTKHSCPLCHEGIMETALEGIETEYENEITDQETSTKLAQQIRDSMESGDNLSDDTSSVSGVSLTDEDEGVSIHEDPQLHGCRFCEEYILNSDELIFHSLQKHGNSNIDYYPCVLCDRIFRCSSNLVKHCTGLHNKSFDKTVHNQYVCSSCESTFITHELLLSHKCVKQAAGEFSCKECGLGFESAETLNFHMNIHQTENGDLYVCEFCGDNFVDETKLQFHIDGIHSKASPRTLKSFTCYCGRIYHNKKRYYTHLKYHKVQRNEYKCDTCSKSFEKKDTLKEHLISHTTVKPFQCHICGKYLNRQSRLKIHVLSHEMETLSSQQLFYCSNCSEVFPSEQLVATHIQDFTDICQEFGKPTTFQTGEFNKVFQCEYCERCYSSHNSLNDHRYRHKEPRLYSCGECKMQFSAYARVQTHKSAAHKIEQVQKCRDIINVPKMYGCDQCDKYYLQWAYLRVHRKLHHAQKKPEYKCKMCDATFPNPWTATYHRKTFHPEEKGGSPTMMKSFTCPICGHNFSSKHTLQNHCIVVHDVIGDDNAEALQCEECGRMFASKVSLKSHMHSHRRKHACKQCGITFSHASGLSGHMRRHKGDLPYACKFCDKRFFQRYDRNDHERLHTGEKPWICNTCSKTFRTRSMWFQHCRIHKDERPFPCNICGMAFQRSYSLKHHRCLKQRRKE